MKYFKRITSLTLVGLMTLSTMSFASVEKEETVYVNLRANGEPEKIIVSDWIHSSEKGVEIQDISDLENIQNVKGNEKPEIDGNKLTWQLEQNDLYYQGETQKELPFNVSILYSLDGKEVEAKDILGESGHLVMNLDFSLSQKDVPFTLIGVLPFSTDHFKNIKCEDVKVINEGSNEVLNLLSVVGLDEQLPEINDFIQLKNSYTIEADVEEFELLPMVFTAQPLPVDKMEGKSEKIDKFGDITSKVTDLGDATNKLTDAAEEIRDNQKKLADASNSFLDATKKLSKGTDALNEGAKKAKEGSSAINTAISQLAKGIMPLSQGMGQYGKGAAEYAKGAVSFGEKTKEFSAKISGLLEGVITLGDKTRL